MTISIAREISELIRSEKGDVEGAAKDFKGAARTRGAAGA
jgi:hypothetical protein